MFARNKCYQYIYLIRSQAHNEFFSCDYLIDVLLAPFFHIADNSNSWLGISLVICIFCLTCLVLTFAYGIGIPYYWSINRCLCICLITVGHWILINVLYNLYKAIVTKPGYPPLSQKLISVCKKCFISKPPRTHHCSVCNRCILKMDHHCPWINNCVGFFNHRYFFLYMVYLLIGVIFLTVFGFNVAWKLIFEDSREDENIYGYPVNETNESTFDHITDELLTHTLPHFKKLILYVALIVLSALASMIYFVYWHAKLITQGQTIIEYYINSKESKKCATMKKKFRNPYDFGPLMNWKLFLGIKNNESVFRQVLFPCEYRPIGDGTHWKTVFDQ